MERSSLDPVVRQMLEIARCDRWQPYQRRQELKIYPTEWRVSRLVE